METLLEEIKNYWTNRAEGYSQVNCQELATGQGSVWMNEIKKHIPKKEGLKILDIGTGPGFFAIILAGEGFDVTAIDCTSAMLDMAKQNSRELRENIKFMLMDAQKLEFADETFDVVISRNLTWNLENPQQAYMEWTRVLKKDGVILNFDANWYHHLYDDHMRQAYEQDRRRTSEQGVEDHYTCTDIDTMEKIAKEVPLSRIMRPQWDEKILKDCGISDVFIDINVWENVWSYIEKLNYASTPMFLVRGIKR